MPPVNPLWIRFTSAMHLCLYRVSGGFIGGNVIGTPVLLLTTTGRKSGRPRTRPLPCLEDDGAYVVIASNGGNATHPNWYLNLKKQPEAEVLLKGKKLRVRAETATGADRERLWAKAVELYAGYDGYQKETEREIPVVVLRPVEGSSP
ncbi:MAG: nitroreductase family deazaflavin-dependent oxidoreductase [Dehalococcoidia bacterium]